MYQEQAHDTLQEALEHMTRLELDNWYVIGFYENDFGQVVVMYSTTQNKGGN